jgi:N-acylneuraminate cytidylyltransferase
VSEIDNVVVSSNSEEMLQMALDEGVGAHRREDKYCDEFSVPFSEVVKHVCEHIPGDYVLWAPCVSPLVEPHHYAEAINVYLQDTEHDSLVTVRKFKEYLWDEHGSVNYDAGKGHLPSQELPDMWLITNGMFLARRKNMIAWEYLLGKKPYKYEVDKRAAIDIDDDIDYVVAKALYAMESHRMDTHH